MSKDYNTIHLIQDKMSGMEDNLMMAVVRMYNKLNTRERYASSLSTSITLFLAMRRLGYEPKLILGTVRVQDITFQHAWIDLNDKIFDVAIATDTKYHPVLKDRINPVNPQINAGYDETDVEYYDFQFADTWEMHSMKLLVGKTFAEYIDIAEGIDIMAEVCDIIGAPTIVTIGKEIYEDAKSYIIKDNPKDVYHQSNNPDT